MSRPKKSYWQKASVTTERDKAAVKSWFAPLCNDMTPESAEILIEIATDREKKIRALMVDAKGKKVIAERTRGGRTFSISLKAAA